MGRNIGFNLITDLNKGCSLLKMLKLNVKRGLCSSVGLDTNILIGTSVLGFFAPKPYVKGVDPVFLFDRKFYLVKILKR